MEKHWLRSLMLWAGVCLGTAALTPASALASPGAADAPLLTLQRQQPKLYALYQAYPAQVPELAQYAVKQGFAAPYEQLATVVHELIHVDSYAHQGFYIDGIYYEPYVRRGAWPAIDNGDIEAQLPSNGPVYRAYVRQNPQNHLGNVIDEINAYGHVLPFVCLNEYSSAAKQVSNLEAFLVVEETYLRILRQSAPAAYAELAADPAARGALLLVTERAYTALDQCGAAGAYLRIERDRFSRKGK